MKSRVIATALCALTLTNAADAAPTVGAALPNGRVVDAEGNALEFRNLRGKPLLLVYENKEATTQNLALKEELSKLARGEKYRQLVSLIAVADVEGYDYWPARGFVKKAIRTESKKLGNTIYVDWNGATRRALGLTEGKSGVVLTDSEGKVLFSREGALDASARATLLGLLRQQVEARDPS